MGGYIHIPDEKIEDEKIEVDNIEEDEIEKESNNVIEIS